MPVAIEMRFKGASLEQYDKAMELMDLEDTPPDGAIFHWVAETDDGILVVDVWDTMKEFESFARDHIGPATAEAGIESAPAVTTHTLHNTLPA